MMDEDLELKAAFIEEAKQLLQEAEQCFLELETDCSDSKVDLIFRLAHNLKGTSRSVGFDELSSFTHELEELILKIKNKELEVKTSTVDLLLKCNDHLKFMLEALQANPLISIDSDPLVKLIKKELTGESEKVINKISEIVSEAPQEEKFEVSAIKEKNHTPKNAVLNDDSIRVSLKRIDSLLNNVGELVILQSVLAEQSGGIHSALIQKTISQLSKITKEIQSTSMNLRMVPLKQTFQKMQRIVRDTSSALGKEAVLSVTGEDTEVDKTVLEYLSDPLVHLVRNAVDHGLESGEERTAAGKNAVGSVFLNAYHRGSNFVIEIKEDGRGLDLERIRSKALEKGILSNDAVVSDREIYNCIFHPGFSTKSQVSDISGRGVGLDVVKTNLELLGGTISLETTKGEGTCFKITLPLTLAIIEGIIIKTGNEKFVVPVSQVFETIQASDLGVSSFFGIGDVLNLRGEAMPIFELTSVLGRKKEMSSLSEAMAVIIKTDSKSFAIVVDEIVGQQPVVTKQLGEEMKCIRGFSGSTVLGDGKPALILDMTELIKNVTYKRIA